mmetsp:Transcript_47290/g.97605  ORF Transcript_47290/g.97605 Transcript_47290/m.97605 type:complete len:87 (+) Transcript_47290:92-352(+)
MVAEASPPSFDTSPKVAALPALYSSDAALGCDVSLQACRDWVGCQQKQWPHAACSHRSSHCKEKERFSTCEANTAAFRQSHQVVER